MDETARPGPGVDPEAICSLPPDDLQGRLAWIRAEILPHALGRERLEDGVAWELADAPGLAAKLDRLVALERACCGGVVFAHRPGRRAGRRRLEVRGVDPDARVFAAPGARASRAGGLGALASLFVCCVLPAVIAAALGASLAAPLASLDHPTVIGATAVAFAAGALAWERRRRSR